MDEQVVRFPGPDGHTLAGVLDGKADAQGTALFAHCFTCSKDVRAARMLSRALADADYRTLRFDFSGLGESEGDFAATNFTSNVAELEAAARYLSDEGMAPGLLVGHSLGGAAVLAAASRLDSVRAIATIGAPHAPSHVKHLFEDQLETLAERGEATFTLAGRSLPIRQSLVDDLERYGNAAYLAELRRALLVMHSPTDEIVGVENARLIYDGARHPKSFIALDGADHMLSKPSDARFAAQMIASWATRYL